MPEPKPAATAAFLARAIAFCGKTNRQIAEEAGFERPNVISMMSQGQMKIPLDRAPALARACHVDPVHLLRLAMNEYHPEIWDALTGTIGEPLTANEWDMVVCYRMVAKNDQIETTPVVCAAIMDTLLAFREKPE